MFRRSWIALLAVVVGVGSAVAAELPSAGETAAAVGFNEKDQKKVLAGEIVAADLPETTDKMLSQAIAVLLPVEPAQISERLQSLELFQADKSLVDFGTIDPANPEAGLVKLVFAENEAKEAANFLNSNPGSEFNLSTDEFAKVKAAAASGDTSPAAASKVYQDILAERVKAFAADGIKGIAPYDRGDGDASSASEDLEAMATALTFIQKNMPSIYQAILNYPNDKPSDAEEIFTWEKRTVQDRPVFTLVHRMIVHRPELLLVLTREFFVGHNYNASQTAGGGFPVTEGTLVLSGNRTTTDQVAGFMSGTRHSIGRGMMRDELVEKFEQFRAQFAK